MHIAHERHTRGAHRAHRQGRRRAHRSRRQALGIVPVAVDAKTDGEAPATCVRLVLFGDAVAAVARSMSETPAARRESTVPPCLCSRPYAFSGWRGSGAKVRRAGRLVLASAASKRFAKRQARSHRPGSGGPSPGAAYGRRASLPRPGPRGRADCCRTSGPRYRETQGREVRDRRVIFPVLVHGQG